MNRKKQNINGPEVSESLYGEPKKKKRKPKHKKMKIEKLINIDTFDFFMTTLWAANMAVIYLVVTL